MDKERAKGEAKQVPTAKTFEVEMPKLPGDFRGAQYGNSVMVGASAQEVFFDLFQGGPEAGGHREGSVVFVGRFIFPLSLAKMVISQLQGLVESIERDTGRELPGPKEVKA